MAEDGRGRGRGRGNGNNGGHRNPDLRPPLPPDHPYPGDHGLRPDERHILRSLLCRMYSASEVMELGTETRFTALVLFQRYYFALLLLQQSESKSASGPTVGSDEKQRRLRNEQLGTVAAACLFLGCKVEEEHRRIRDVINLAHMMDFARRRGDGVHADAKVGAEAEAEAEPIVASNSTSTNSTTTTIHIHEASGPPNLDDAYWDAKEKIVATEQNLLRMLHFDASVSHPHRAVLLILDGLGVVFPETRTRGLLMKEAWALLNNAVFYPPALRQPLLPLACGAIRLASDRLGGDDRATTTCTCTTTGKDDGTIPPVGGRGIAGEIAALPCNWWRDMDVSDMDIDSAVYSLECAIESLGTA